jgi:glycosyltransferase involved in cell wall biosynthesis
VCECGNPLPNVIDAPASAGGGSATQLKPMKLILLCHPGFFASQSMPRFAQMLKTSYEARGHSVEVWSPRARAIRYVPRGRLSKWAGYIDQYVFFPAWIRGTLRRVSEDTLFVFCDQALGPWVPLVKHRHHVVHVHDLLALRSAVGELPENATSLTGRIYQRYIRWGFRQARYFIAVSHKTRADLLRYGGIGAAACDVVYNGLNYPYAPVPASAARAILGATGMAAPEAGMILHVGGGQWYKNLLGIVAIYSRYASQAADPLPLWCVSPNPTSSVRSALAQVPARGQVLFLGNLDSAALQALYSLAKAFLFPSLAEGFGWPLIEAQACGCPVITTDEAPMNEVAGPAARYLARLSSPQNMDAWASHGAVVLQDLLAENPADKAERAQVGRNWASRFDANKAIEEYLVIYRRILANAR